MAGNSCTSSSSSSSNESGSLGTIAWQVERSFGKQISLAARCHKYPSKLDRDYVMSNKVLGVGCSGKVHMARSRTNSQQIVAVKTFKLKSLTAGKRERLMSEASIFLCMDHPHVARLLDVYESESQMHIVMECMEGGELFDRASNEKRFTEAATADAAKQMLLAVNYLHGQGVVHRDIKMENFLYDSPSSNHLKMIDFGFSKFCDSRGKMKTQCGTLSYIAPEVLSRNYTPQCDIWSIGVIVYVLLSGRFPFHGTSNDKMTHIKKGKYKFEPEKWARLSKRSQDFTKALLEMNPSKRLTAKGALEHAWIKQNCREAGKCDTSILSSLSSFALAPKMYRACMAIMAWSLTNKQHAKVRDHFLALDKSGNGVISLSEFQDALGKDGEAFDEESCRVFAAVTQGRSKMYYSDFLAAMLSSQLNLEEDMIQATFKRFESQGTSGSTQLLSAQAIGHCDFKRILGSSVEGEEIDAFIHDASLSGDAKLDYKEFAKHIRETKAQLLTPVAHEKAFTHDYSVTSGDETEQEALHDFDDQPVVGKERETICAPWHLAVRTNHETFHVAYPLAPQLPRLLGSSAPFGATFALSKGESQIALVDAMDATMCQQKSLICQAAGAEQPSCTLQ